MKNILCFGDSNTYGVNTEGGPRYDETVRWPMVLQKLLGDGYHVHENGLNGRTTVYDDPALDFRNGRKSVPYAFLTTFPLDLVVIMLGTNDVKFENNGTPEHAARCIAFGADAVIQEFRNIAHSKNATVPAFLLIAPPHVNYKNTFFRFTKEGCDVSLCFSQAFEDVARNQKALFLDAAPLCSTGSDGLHLTKDSHKALAEAVAEIVKANF